MELLGLCDTLFEQSMRGLKHVTIVLTLVGF